MQYYNIIIDNMQKANLAYIRNNTPKYSKNSGNMELAL